MAINIIIYTCTTALAYDMLYSLLSWQWWAYVTMSPLVHHIAVVIISWPGWWSSEQLLQQSWWFTPDALVRIKNLIDTCSNGWLVRYSIINNIYNNNLYFNTTAMDGTYMETQLLVQSSSSPAIIVVVTATSHWHFGCNRY